MVYLQDNFINTEIETPKGGEIRLKPNDIISIFVSSKNTIFNLPRVQQTIGNTSSTSASGGQHIMIYRLEYNIIVSKTNAET